VIHIDSVLGIDITIAMAISITVILLCLISGVRYGCFQMSSLLIGKNADVVFALFMCASPKLLPTQFLQICLILGINKKIIQVQ
jgi:hypothetical protein